MRVRVLFAVTKTHSVLGNQRAQGMQQVARHIRIGILVNCQTRRRVLHIEHDHAFLRCRFAQLLLHLICKFDEFLALPRAHRKRVHV